MSIVDRLTLPRDLAQAHDDARDAAVAAAFAEVVGAEDTIGMLKEELYESLGDVEQLQAEDRGWLSLTAWGQQQFSRAGLQSNANIARVMLVVNPLCKRGSLLRIAYVWGQGVSISADAGDEKDATSQDVNAVIQAFLDDESNKTSFTSAQAQEELERVCQTDGNITLALFTDRVTGRVEVRSLCFDEMEDVITNPEDRNEPWFYLREWATRDQAPGIVGRTVLVNQTKRMYYPALGFMPAQRPKVINGIAVDWETPVLHAKVNSLDGWQWGIGDLYAALPWARAYKDFLTDWARLVKALSRFAWRLSADKSSKATKAAAALQSVVDYPIAGESNAGATAYMGPGANLEAIPKSGATIDSNSGKPLAGMAAAGLGVPVTMLLADPGITGARATADTLDKPTEFEMGLRREFWTAIIKRICGYVVEQAVRAPQGPLKGTVKRVSASRQTVELAGDQEMGIDVSWPDLSGVDVETLMKAIALADGMDHPPPPLVLVKLALEALGVDDVDEIMAEITDDDGHYIDQGAEARASAGQAAVDAFRRGQDPALAV